MSVRCSLLAVIFSLLLIPLEFASAAGPDAFGYRSISSSDQGGPAFQPIDISTTGSRQEFINSVTLDPEDENADDGVSYGISLSGLNGGQGFPFYGEFKTTVYMSTNGFLTFSRNAAAGSSENTCPIQNASQPNGIIAALWDDIKLETPYSAFAGGFSQSFTNCPHSGGGTGACVIFQWNDAVYKGNGESMFPFDFHVILYANGNVLMNYPSGNIKSGSGSTTGLENVSGSIGLTHRCNTSSSIAANSSVLFTSQPAPSNPSIELKAGVALCQPDPNNQNENCQDVCNTPALVKESLVAPLGTKIRLCYVAKNTGDVTLNRHDLTSDQFGPLLTNTMILLSPNNTSYFTQKSVVAGDAQHNLSWTGRNGALSASATDTIQIYVSNDGDDIPDSNDNCPAADNDDQLDSDNDGVGDACELVDDSDDGDGVASDVDNCPTVANANQLDRDGDGIGDACELCPTDALKTTPGICGCGVEDVDLNGNGKVECADELGTVDTAGQCVAGGGDCAFEKLEPSACVGANGFLGQVNIASVVNLQPGSLKVKVKLFDAAGALAGQVATTLAANIRQDFIINDLGLKPDTVGTVCVETNAAADGLWTGGITLYKQDQRGGATAFGDAFDFALYYPFQNASFGTTAVPLNTFHLGTDPAAVVANWISIADGTPGDKKPLKGTLKIFNDQGVVVQTTNVNIPDGGRADFPGHDGLTNGKNNDAIGMAQFNSVSAGGYFMTLTRYFYDCPGASCTNFLAAFNIPRRPATERLIGGGVSTVNGEIAVVELNNVSSKTANKTDVNVFGTSGSSQGKQLVEVPKLGTRHVVVNASGASGFLAANTVGASTVDAKSGAISALSIFYKLNTFGRLEYAYAAPMLESPGLVQLSQFNSFIQHTNDLEVFNTNASARKVAVNYIDFAGKSVFQVSLDIPGRGVSRLQKINLPADTYGTVTVDGDKAGIVVRNYVSRDGQYTLPFPGQ